VISTDCPFIINLNTLSFTDTLHRINNGVPGTGGERAERYMAEGEYDSAYSEFQSMSLISGRYNINKHRTIKRNVQKWQIRKQ
jgi:hypothetical protein